MLRRQLTFAGIALGVLTCYSAFGVMQEKIFRGRYGDEIQPDGKKGEVFMLPIIFESLQFALNALVARGEREG
jgi:solute carrier family 35 (UDP-galactose transporter), member B1